MVKPIFDSSVYGKKLTLDEAWKLIELARRKESTGYEFLFLDEKTKIIYEAVDNKHFGGAVAVKGLDDAYFKTTSVEAFGDMLWFELKWSVNVNCLKNNDALMRLFR